jgi:inorganic pyrophosphatase
MDLTKLPARDREGNVHFVVESPRGSGMKLKYEPELGCFVLARVLALGVTYPFDWGFIPGTLAPDGDPLDAMVITDTPSYPGVVLASAPIGVVRVEQDEEGGRKRNDRVIAVPVKASRFDEIRDEKDISKRMREEIQQFFLTVVFFSNKNVQLLGWGGRDEAVALIEDCARRYAQGG